MNDISYEVSSESSDSESSESSESSSTSPLQNVENSDNIIPTHEFSNSDNSSPTYGLFNNSQSPILNNYTNNCTFDVENSSCPTTSFLTVNNLPSFNDCTPSTIPDPIINASTYYTNQIIDLVGEQNEWSLSNNLLNLNINIPDVNLTNNSSTITNNYITNTNTNSDSSNEEEQTTDYNNEESINEEPNISIPPPNLSLENINNMNLDSNLTVTEINSNSGSNQYSMLYNDDADNPFYKCNLGELDYETDEEENLNKYRIIYFWNYEFNYDYFSLNETFIFNNKTEIFKSKLNELKTIRNANNSNTTGNILKIECSNKLSNIVNLYLIAYYDNAKTNIEFYGIYNQEIDEEKLLENIIRESIYGKKGIVSSNIVSNLGENDFIVLHRKINIV